MLGALITVAAVALVGMGFAGTAVALALRVGTKTAELGAAHEREQAVTLQLHETATEFADHKRRTDAQFATARADIEELQHELAAATVAIPGAARARLDGLLSKLQPRAGRGAQIGALPAPTAADVADDDPPVGA